MFNREDMSRSEAESRGTANPGRKFAAGRWIEVLLLATGVLLLAVYGAARLDRVLSANALLRSFQTASTETPARYTDTAPIQPASPANSDAHESRSESSERPSTNRDASTAETPLAVLRIPKLHLEAPVLEGTDARTLNHAVGRIAGTAGPGERGNIALAAHRDSFFRNLGKLRAGDSLVLQTATTEDTYVVDQIRIVKPEDVWVLNPRPSPTLTLVTCYPFRFLGSAPERYIVAASLVERQASNNNPHGGQ